MLPDGIGWAVAPADYSPRAPLGVYRSNDGGAHWHRLLTTDDGGGYYARFFDGERAVVAYTSGSTVASKIYATSDAGAHWSMHALPATSVLLRGGVGGGVSSMYFATLDEGWLLKRLSPPGQEPVIVLHSIDGGATWSDMGSLPAGPSGEIKTGITFSDSKTGRVVTQQSDPSTPPTIYVTRDSAKTWTIQRLQLPTGIYPGFAASLDGVIDFGNGRLGAVLTVAEGSMGVGGPESLYVYVSPDGGQSWNAPAKVWSDKTALAGIPSASSQSLAGWWVGSGTQVQITNDGGRSWQQRAVPIDPPFQLRELHAISSDSAFALASRMGSCVDQSCDLLLVTEDSGGNWRVIADSGRYPNHG
jgi:photosystem II stability/assembly factor-like uncharacterized protein